MFISFIVGLVAGVFVAAVNQINRIKEYEEEIACMESEYHRYMVRIGNLEKQLEIYEKGGKPEKSKLAKLIEEKSDDTDSIYNHIPRID